MEDFQNKVIKLVWKRVLMTIFGGFSILTIIGIVLYLYSMYTAYEKGTKKAEQKIEELITNKFSEPHISKLMTEVASDESAALLAKEVNPAIEKFKEQLDEGRQSMEKFTSDLKSSYQSDFESLSKEIAILSERNRIAELGDKAVLSGDREAFDRLKEISSSHENESIRSAALSESRRVKGFWSGVTSLKGTNLISTKEGEEDFKASDFGTNRLIMILLTHEKFGARALAAAELGKRKEPQVLDALISSIESDKNLEVVKNSVDAFESITEFKCPDVFGFEQIPIWWEKNKDEVKEKLKPEN